MCGWVVVVVVDGWVGGWAGGGGSGCAEGATSTAARINKTAATATS